MRTRDKEIKSAYFLHSVWKSQQISYDIFSKEATLLFSLCLSFQYDSWL